MNDKMNNPLPSPGSDNNSSENIPSPMPGGDEGTGPNKEEKTFETFESNDFEQSAQPSGSKISIKDFIQNKYSEVSAGTGSKGIVVIILVGILLGGIYMLFSSPEAVKERDKADKDAKLQEKKEELLKTAKAPSVAVDIGPPLTSTPKKDLAPPAPPQLTAPKPPAPPPPPVPSTPQAPVFPASQNTSAPSGSAPGQMPGMPPVGISSGDQGSSLVDVLSGDAAKKKQELLARRKASIMVTGGGEGGIGEIAGGGKDAADKDLEGSKSTKEKPKDKKSSFLGFDNGISSASSSRTSAAESVEATHIGALDRMIAQGKILNAVLESAINTDIPGSLRAIVARDVFAENGHNILIPKGSRLIGTYDTQAKTGQQRIGVMWNRLIRPDGVDVAIASSGTDELGRAGVQGYADDKFWVKIGTAVLTSYIVPVVAKKLLNVKDSAVTSTTTTGANIGGTGPTTSTTTTGSTGSQQLQDTVNKLQDSITSAVNDSISTKTTVTIDQGTMVNVYVNKDILFTPEQVYGTARVIQ